MGRPSRVFIASLVFVLLHCIPTAAQSVLNFPRVISGPEVFTGIAVSNPDSNEASVTFSAFQPDGTPLTPTTIKIPAGGQYVRLFSEIFGFTGEFNGWMQATSSSKGLSGFFLNSNGSVTDLDGAAVTEPSAEMILPFMSESDNAKSEVTALNPNGEAANVTFTLFAADGQQIASKDVTIAGRSLVRQTLSNLFTGSDRSAASYVRLRSDRTISAHELVADFRVAGTALARESAALAGLRPSDDKTYILSQFVTGGGWLSVLGVVNAAGIDQDITLTAFGENGLKLDLPSNPKRLTLAGNAALRSTVADLFSITNTDLKTGWIEVRGSIGRLVSFIGSGNTMTPSFASVAGVGASAASRYQVYSQVSEGGGFFSGLTLVNTAQSPAIVDFYVLNSDGTTVGKATFSIPANGRTGRLFSELVPAAFNQTGGWVFVRSTQPVIGAELFGSTNGYSLATVPSQPAGDFKPPPQAAASVSGAVREAGAGVGNVVITITGPVTATKTTDASGRYNFSQLPRGDYKVSVSRTGLAFAPTDRSVGVGAENLVDVNFEAAGGAPSLAPNISFITPGSTLVGNATLNLRILGSNFSASSVVRLNNAPVQTTFINAGELQAVVPSTLMRSPADVSVQVVTPPPGGGTSTSLLLVVVPQPSNPLIEGRVGVGSFPSGVAIHPGRQIAVVSNQSSDTVSIVDLKTLKVTGEVKVGRSPAEGIAIHAGRDLALAANTGGNSVTVIDLSNNTVKATIPVETSPVSIAINTVTNRALVANLGSDSVSIIDLDTLSVIGKIVAALPSSVAINPITNVAVIAKRAANEVAIVDLRTNTVQGTVAVGRYPRAVAINPARNIAVVANANAATITIIDLATRTVLGTVAVGAGPTAVAIHAVTNNALVSNSGFCLTGCQNLPGLPATVSIVNLDQREVLETVPVGSTAFGVDIDASNQRAVVANYGSSDTTVVRIPNPNPRISSFEPRSFPSGGGDVAITVRGSGFVPTSVVTLNGRTLSTTYVSNVELRAILPADLVAQLLSGSAAQSLPAGKGGKPAGFSGGFPATLESIFNLGVSSPGPGGGASPSGSSTQILPENKAAVLWSISPSETTSDVQQVDITLNGNNFNTTTRVNFGSGVFAPVSVSSTTLTISVPRSSLTAGAYSVSATNPAPGGGASGPKSFVVLPPANPIPVVRSISPASVTAGSGATSFTISGSGFTGQTTASVAGQSVGASVSSEAIQFTLPANLFASTVTLPVLVSTPSPGGGTAGTSISVLNPVPAVSSISPPSANAGADSVAIVVSGSQFTDTSQIVLESAPIATVFVNSTRLLGTIPGVILRHAGPLQVSVENSPPGGGRASGGVFMVNAPSPLLTSLNPPKVRTSKTEVAIAILGSGFLSNSRVFVNNAAVVSAADSLTQLTATLPPALVAKGGVLSVFVENPAPGGRSAALQLTVENPVPAVERVAPVSVRADQENIALNVFGKDFVDGSVISLGNAVLTTTFVSDTQLSAPLPSVIPLGVSPLTVVSAAPGGGTSNAIPFEVLAAVPRITSVTPAVVGPGQTVRVNGANFGQGTSATVGSIGATVNVTSATELQLTIPANVPVGTASIVLSNPPNLDSQPFAVQVANPVPVIASLDPESVRAGAGISNITVKGSGFVSGSVVKVDGNNVFTQYVDTTTLRFVITAPALPGTLKVTVFNSTPGGGTSNGADLKVLSPVPRISYLSPSEGTQGSSVELLVVGSGFIEGAVIYANGNALPTTFSNADAVRASLSLSAAGTITIKVVNPGGVESGEVAFTVTVPLNPQPAITTISPSSIPANTATAMVVTGTNLSSVATVMIDSNVVPFTANSGSQIALSSGQLASGSHTLSVTVPAPGGGTATKSFTVASAENPVPAITAVSPAPSGVAAALVITGTGFIAQSAVKVDSNAAGFTLNSSTQITTNDVTLSAGPHKVTVTNPTPGGGTVEFSFTASPGNPSPAISQISPNPVPANTATSLTVSGSGFMAGGTVKIDTNVVTFSVVSSSEMTVNTSSLSVGPHTLTITNPAPGGGTASLSFQAYTNPAPTISGTSPTPVLANAATTMTVNGTGFISGATVKIDSNSVSFSVASPTQMTINLNVSEGSHTLTIINPAPGGGTATQTFSASAPTVNVAITIRDVTTGQALAGATVVVNAVTATTNASGGVQFSVPIGTRSVQISASGYLGRSFTRPISLSTTSLVMRVYPAIHGEVVEVDTDHDGLPDRVETNTRIFVSIDNTGTDPNNPDSDGDGLNDGVEVLDGPEVIGVVGLFYESAFEVRNCDRTPCHRCQNRGGGNVDDAETRRAQRHVGRCVGHNDTR